VNPLPIGLPAGEFPAETVSLRAGNCAASASANDISYQLSRTRYSGDIDLIIDQANALFPVGDKVMTAAK